MPGTWPCTSDALLPCTQPSIHPLPLSARSGHSSLSSRQSFPSIFPGAQGRRLQIRYGSGLADRHGDQRDGCGAQMTMSISQWQGRTMEVGSVAGGRDGRRVMRGGAPVRLQQPYRYCAAAGEEGCCDRSSSAHAAGGADAHRRRNVLAARIQTGEGTTGIMFICVGFRFVGFEWKGVPPPGTN